MRSWHHPRGLKHSKSSIDRKVGALCVSTLRTAPGAWWPFAFANHTSSSKVFKARFDGQVEDFKPVLVCDGTFEEAFTLLAKAAE